MRVPGIISHKKLQPGVHSQVFSHMDLLPLSKHSLLFVVVATFYPSNCFSQFCDMLTGTLGLTFRSHVARTRVSSTIHQSQIQRLDH